MRTQAGLAGTGTLIRLALRRDRIVLPLWVVLLAAIPASTAGAYDALYPTAESRAALGAGLGANPSMSLLYGPAFDLTTAGGFTAWRYGTFIALFVGLACAFTVTRHTRAEEDSGRLELLGSGVLGRYAALTAALLVAGGAATASGLIAALGLIGAGLPTAGSLSFGLGMAAAGLVFTGIAGVAAQLAEYSRTANGIAVGTIGLTFLLRAVGDSSPDLSGLSWASPIGWNSQLRSFAGERWWVLGLFALTALLAAVVAYALLARRDVGMGLVPARPGPATAAPGLRSPLALAWRLHRGSLIGWVAAFAVMGALFGAMADGIGAVVGDSAQVKQMLSQLGGADGLIDAFLASILNVFGMIAALYGVAATLRMRGEETALRAEPILATPVRRLRWTASHLTFALLGSALVLVIGGIGLGLSHGLRTGDVGGALPGVFGGALAQLPAAWLITGITVLLFGFAPRFAAAAWGVAAALLLLSLFGPLARLPQPVLDVSPFTHVPKFPGAEFSATPVVWLTVLAAVAVAAGLAGFRRRDVG